MTALLKVWVDSKKENAARLVAERVREKLGGCLELVSIAEYHKGGHEMHFRLSLDSNEWPGVVYELMTRAQTLGRLWTISGRVEEETDLFSKDISVAGVTAAHLVMQKKEPNQRPERNAGAASLSTSESTPGVAHP